MRFWIVTLRLIGILLTMWLLIGIVRVVGFIPLYRFSDAWYGDAAALLERLALAAICFGAASLLNSQRRMEARIASATSRRRAASPQPQYREDLAPIAPDWKPLPDPLPMNTELERWLARGARNHVVIEFDEQGRPYIPDNRAPTGAPTEREVPAPIRQTPGTEDYYAPVKPPSAPPPNNQPPDLAPTKYTLRRGRDAQIRQAQQRSDTP